MTRKERKMGIVIASLEGETISEIRVNKMMEKERRGTIKMFEDTVGECGMWRERVKGNGDRE